MYLYRYLRKNSLEKYRNSDDLFSVLLILNATRNTGR